jgi:tetratricopeptide (TPR) repeat protein
MSRLIPAFVLLVAAQGLAQDIPEPKGEAVQAVTVLIKQCIDDGAIKGESNEPDTSPLRVESEEKLQTALNGVENQWTADLRNAFIANVARSGPARQPALTAALRVAGEIAKDELAIGVGLYHQGRDLENQNKPAEAFETYVAADVHCSAAKSLTWQGACQNRMGIIRLNENRLDESRQHLELALKLRRQHGGDEHLDVAHSLNNLGVIDLKLKRFQDAVSHHELALAIRKKVLGARNAYVVQSLRNLADAYRQAGEKGKQLASLEEALELQKALLGEEHADVADTLRYIGAVHYDAARYQDAERAFRAALTIRERLFKESALVVINNRIDVADTVAKLGRAEEAIAIFQKVAATYQSMAQGDDENVATVWNRMGETYRETKNYEQALNFHKQAVELQRSKLGAQHLAVSSTLYSIAQVHLAMGKHRDVVQAIQEAVDIRKANWGVEDARIIKEVTLLANLQISADERLKAVKLFEEALEIRRKHDLDRNADAVQLWIDIANNQQANGESSAAIAALNQAGDILAKLPPDNERQTPSLWRSIGNAHYTANRFSECIAAFNQALEIQRQVAGEQSEFFGDLLNDLANAYSFSGRFEQAVTYYTRGMELFRALPGGDAKYAGCVRNLAFACSRANKYEEAASHHRQALELRRKAFGEVHAKVAESLNDLAWEYVRLGRKQQCIDLFEEGIRIRKQSADATDRQVANDLRSFGNALYAMRQYSEAVQRYQQALELRRNAASPNQLEIAESLTDIADCARMRGENKAAITQFEDVLRLRRQQLSRDDAAVANIFRLMGWAYQSLANYSTAVDCHRQSLEIRKVVYGDNHNEVATGLCELASALARLKKTSECIALFDESLRMRRALLGPDHYQISEDLSQFGDALYVLEKYPDAINRYEQAIESRRNTLAANDPKVTSLIVKISECMRLANDYEKAIARLQEAVTLRREFAGRDDEGVADALRKVGVAYYAWNKYSEAQKFEEEALEIQEKILGLNHVDISYTLIDLGLIDKWLDNYEKAVGRFERALAIRRKALGDDHVDVAWSRLYLGDAFLAQGRYDDALTEYEVAAAAARKADNSSALAAALRDLAFLAKRRGQYSDALELFREAEDICRKTDGDESDAVARCLRDRANVYYAASRYEEAKEFHQKALALYKQVHGNVHRQVAVVLEDLGDNARNQDRFQEALDYYNDALQIREQIFGSDSELVADSLRVIAHVYLREQQTSEAVSRYQRALAIRERTLGPKHSNVADILADLGAAFRGQMKFDEALDYYSRCMDIRRATLGENHAQVATALNAIGWVYYDRADFDEAIKRFEQAKEIRQKAFGEASEEVALSLNDIAYTRWNQGSHLIAISLHERALAILSRAGSNLGWTEYQLAWCYEEIDEYGKSLEHFLEAEKHYSASLGASHPKVTVSQLAIARVLSLLGRTNEAIDYYFRNTSEPDEVRFPDESAQIYSRRGSFWASLNLHSSASREFRKAVALIRKTKGARDSNLATNLHLLGESLSNDKSFDDAKSAFQEALTVKKNVYGPQHLEVGRTLFEYARVYSQIGDFAEAMRLTEEAISSVRLKPERPGVADSPDNFIRRSNVAALLRYRSWVYEQSIKDSQDPAEWKRLQEYLRLAAAVMDLVRTEVTQSDDNKYRLTSNNSYVATGRLRAAKRLFELEKRVEYLEEAFLACEDGTARAFLDSLGKSRALQVGGVSPDLRSAESQIIAESQSLEKNIHDEVSKSLEKRDSRKLSQLAAQLSDADARLKKLVTTFEREYPQYAALKYPKPCTLKEARRCLTRNELALIYVVSIDGVHLVVVDNDPSPNDQEGGLGIYELASGNELSDLVHTITDPVALAQPRRTESIRKEAYEKLLGPVADRIKGKDLVIVPSSALCFLPFEQLIIPPDDEHEKPCFVIERHGIRYAPSLTSLHVNRLWDKTRTPPTEPLWAIGDPIYGSWDSRLMVTDPDSPLPQANTKTSLTQSGGTSSTANYDRLAYSSIELRNVARVLGVDDRCLRLGRDATEQSVKRASQNGELARARYVHFATHGILGADAGRSHSLVLSMIDNKGEDGLLQVDEVTTLRLNADAVVLSACSSGQGRLYSGEGVRGLARAFVYAGSRSVVCSLWQVDDQITSTLMGDFYRYLQSGAPTDAALRRAKLNLLESGYPPLFWAPFVLIGTGNTADN